MATLRSWYASGRGAFLFRLAGVGAFAGLAAWLLTYAIRLWVGTGPPTARALMWAIPRGAVVGVLLGLFLILYWRRRGAT